jgi:hypothetical protein
VKFIDHDHPFYKPLWRRLIIVAVTALWAVFEVFVSGEGLWVAVSCGVFAISVWTFLIDWKPSSG